MDDDGARFFGGLVSLLAGGQRMSKVRGEVRVREGTVATGLCEGLGLNPGSDLENPMMSSANHSR